jgi:hypothetical protein
MSLFPEPTERPFPREVAKVGPHGGPTAECRGARIGCMRSGHVRALVWEEHPLHGLAFGVVVRITPLIDPWGEERRVP